MKGRDARVISIESRRIISCVSYNCCCSICRRRKQGSNKTIKVRIFLSKSSKKRASFADREVGVELRVTV